MKKVLFPCLLLLFFALNTANAQRRIQVMQADPHVKIDKKAKSEVIENIARLLEKNYVDPDKGKEVAAHLRKQQAAKAYKALEQPNVFAAHVLQEMQQILQDVHLTLRYQPQRMGGSAFDRDEEVTIDEGEGDGEGGEPEVIIEVGPGEGGPDFSRVSPDVLAEMQSRNFGLSKVEILSGNIGYFRIDDFMAAGAGVDDQVASLMGFLQHTNALIIDIRNNPGGGPYVIQQICSYFFEKRTHLNSLYHRPSNTTQDFWTHEEVKGPKMVDKPIYVLISNFTGSAAEEFCYDLQAQKRATLVGETTVGGGHIVEAYGAGHGFELGVPNGKAINPITGTNWEKTGVKPDIEVPAQEALTKAHSEALRGIAEQAETPEEKQEILWSVARLEVEGKTINVDAKTLASYAGTYGPRVVTAAGNALFIQRAPGPKLQLVPMSENTFMYQDLDPFRLQFVVENGKTTGVKLLFPNGEEEFFPKE